MTTSRYNRLTLAQSIQLADELRKQAGESKVSPMSDAKLAKLMSEKLGFKVNDRHVNKQRIALGIVTPPSRGGRGVTSARKRDVEALEARVSALETSLAAAQATIRELQVRAAQGVNSNGLRIGGMLSGGIAPAGGAPNAPVALLAANGHAQN